jgi:integrase
MRLPYCLLIGSQKQKSVHRAIPPNIFAPGITGRRRDAMTVTRFVWHEEMRFLNPDQVDTLAASILPRYRALVLVAAYGGLRIGELAGLRRGRVYILKGTVTVAEIGVEVAGHLHYGKPKTRAGRRTITLPRSVVTILNAHLGEYTAADGDAFVFTAPESGPLRVPL